MRLVVSGGFRKSAILIALGLSVGLVTGCSDSGKETKKNQTTAQARTPTKEDLEVAVKKEEANQPLSSEFPSVSLGEISKYSDILTPVAPLRYYTALRKWEESSEEIIKSVTEQISPSLKIDNSSLYESGYGILTTNDAFRKRELGEKVVEIVKFEAAKVGEDRRLVKISTRSQVDPYNFQLKGFKVSDCMFSDKVAYTDDDRRNPQALANAEKPRCYLRPMHLFNVGIDGGSTVFFDVSDESVARKVEATRQSSHLVVYGYVKKVQRQRLGGRVFDDRYVLVSPQRVDLVDDKTGNILLTKVI